jgi:hypothetical protein
MIAQRTTGVCLVSHKQKWSLALTSSMTRPLPVMLGMRIFPLKSGRLTKAMGDQICHMIFSWSPDSKPTSCQHGWVGEGLESVMHPRSPGNPQDRFQYQDLLHSDVLGKCTLHRKRGPYPSCCFGFQQTLSLSHCLGNSNSSAMSDNDNDSSSHANATTNLCLLPELDPKRARILFLALQSVLEFELAVTTKQVALRAIHSAVGRLEHWTRSYLRTAEGIAKVYSCGVT